MAGGEGRQRLGKGQSKAAREAEETEDFGVREEGEPGETGSEHSDERLSGIRAGPAILSEPNVGPRCQYRKSLTPLSYLPKVSRLPGEENNQGHLLT